MHRVLSDKASRTPVSGSPACDGQGTLVALVGVVLGPVGGDKMLKVGEGVDAADMEI